MSDKVVIRNALISVYKKTREVAQRTKELEELGFKIYASEGTAKFLTQNGVKVIDVERLTGFPPILDRRVVTLHPKIHAGILSKSKKNHEEELNKLGVPRFDLIIVDIYPVWEMLKLGSLEKVLELIDIGGPTMLRAAAKNFNNGRIVICDVRDVKLVIGKLKVSGEVDFKTRKKLAAKVFALMEKYDGAIARFLSETQAQGPTLKFNFSDGRKLRYGENPHQKGWFYEGEGAPDQLATHRFK